MTNILMTFLTVAMYSLSTTHIGLSMRQNLIAFFDQHAADGAMSLLNEQGNRLMVSQIAIELVNVSQVRTVVRDTFAYWRVAWCCSAYLE